MKECLKDKVFYKGKISNPALWNINNATDIDKLPGGVTFSGGECFLQMDKLFPVCEELHRNGIHIAAETCLFCNPEQVKLALNHIDFFYVDMKILDPDRCKFIEHGNFNLYLENINTLLNWKNRNGYHKPIVIRIPVIGTYTDDVHNREFVKELISKYQESILKIELIKEHNLGASKYKSLNMKMSYHGVTNSLMEQYKTELSDLGIPVEICKI